MARLASLDLDQACPTTTIKSREINAVVVRLFHLCLGQTLIDSLRPSQLTVNDKHQTYRHEKQQREQRHRQQDQLSPSGQLMEPGITRTGCFSSTRLRRGFDVGEKIWRRFVGVHNLLHSYSQLQQGVCSAAAKARTLLL